MRTVELSPLEEVERRVQRRAKEICLEMAGEDGRAKLRALIDDEVRAWSDDFRRGRREFDLADPDLVAERAYRNLAGYGPLEPLLADDDVWDIIVGAPVTRADGQRTWSEGVRGCAPVLAGEPFCALLVVQMWCRATRG